MPTSALVINDVPIECLNQAAIAYQIPANLIISILKVEGGRAGMAKPNKNGTFDYGPMQINTVWLKPLKQHGYTKELLQYDPCVNVWVGTWILSQQVAKADSPNVWRSVANYHSRTDDKNVPYQYKVRNIYELLTRYLSGADKKDSDHPSPTASSTEATEKSFTFSPPITTAQTTASASRASPQLLDD